MRHRQTRSAPVLRNKLARRANRGFERSEPIAAVVNTGTGNTEVQRVVHARTKPRNRQNSDVRILRRFKGAESDVTATGGACSDVRTMAASAAPLPDPAGQRLKKPLAGTAED